MRNSDELLDSLTHVVIDAASQVHRVLGPGYMESFYEAALVQELRRCGVPFERQKPLPRRTRGDGSAQGRLDLLIDGQLIVELKTGPDFGPSDHAEVTSYLESTGLPLGLLINFSAPDLARGVKRVQRNR